MAVDTVKRLDLPSGGWWELETWPRWKHLRELLVLFPGGGQPARGPDDQSGLVDQLLVSLTVAWSFGEPVSLTSLARRDTEDVSTAMELLKHEVAPNWEARRPKQLAEELYGSLATGRVPSEFAEAHVMALTGWTWEDLQETPADVVERVALYLAVRQVRESGGSLDFPEERTWATVGK